MHECIIGILYDYENTDLVTLNELKYHVCRELEYRSSKPWLYKDSLEPYSLSDYCDKRKSTDLTRFYYCPICGKEIDWKGIKKGVV